MDSPQTPNLCSQDSLRISNLHWWTNDREVEETLSAHGKVSKVTIPFDKVNGKSCGFAYVFMDTDESVRKVYDAWRENEFPGVEWTFEMRKVKRPSRDRRRRSSDRRQSRKRSSSRRRKSSRRSEDKAVEKVKEKERDNEKEKVEEKAELVKKLVEETLPIIDDPEAESHREGQGIVEEKKEDKKTSNHANSGRRHSKSPRRKRSKSPRRRRSYSKNRRSERKHRSRSPHRSRRSPHRSKRSRSPKRKRSRERRKRSRTPRRRSDRKR